MLAIILVAVIAAVLICFISFLLESCRSGPPYLIESGRYSHEPQEYIILNSTEIGLYPIIGDVIDAVDNPEDHPNAELQNGILQYYTYDERAVEEASGYIHHRYLREISPDNWNHVNIAYDKGDGQGMQYYMWAVTAIDYSVPLLCP